MARAARDFFKDFDVLAPEISIFFLARRGLGGKGVGGGSQPLQLLEQLLFVDRYCNCWNIMFH